MTEVDLHVEAHDLRTAPDAALDAVHRLEVAFEAELHPDDPPTPAEAFRSRYRALPAYRDAYGWTASTNGDVVAALVVDIDRRGNNAHIIEGRIVVAPDHRRYGLGRRLLRPIVETAEVEGRPLLWAATAAGVPSGARFMEWLGAQAAYVERESELDLTTLDRGLVDRWIAEGPTRAAAYEIVLVEQDVPDDLIGQFADLYPITNSAPRENLDMEDEYRTPEQIRESDRSQRESGHERILVMARHIQSGDLAGWTELSRHPAAWWKIEQYWTAVHPDHRGHALGKWLKAAALARALERWPDARKITTGNAYTNDAMLGINNLLGFRETGAWTIWQVPIDHVRTQLPGVSEGPPTS